MIARLLCNAFGHRWKRDQSEWGRKVFRVCWCPRCGCWGATVATPVSFAFGRDDVGRALRVDETFGHPDAVAECRRRAA